jgi:DNA-binding IscR family transcriptional regulator
MAVHVLAVLGYKAGRRATSARLAGSVNTNPVVIRRLLRVLQEARLVETCKGAGAGSCLSRSPGSINLAQVFRAVEADEPFVMPPGKPNPACPVGQCIQAAIAQVFASARKALERDLAKTTLADVLRSVEHRPSSLRQENYETRIQAN